MHHGLVFSTITGKYFCGALLTNRGCPCTHCHEGCNCASCMKMDIENYKLRKGWLVNASGKHAKLMHNGKFSCTKKLNAAGWAPPGDNLEWCCSECDKLDRTINRYRELL